MKNNLFLILGFTTSLIAGELAFAGLSIPLKHQGQVCIEQSTFQLDDVNSTISADYLAPVCESQGGIVSLRSLEIVHKLYGCPFGHQFTYALEGACYIP